MTRSEQKEKRRWDIIKAGLHFFVRKGYEATKISEIAEKAGMSVGLLYHYFESVEALYEALIDIGLSGRSGQYFPEYDNPLDYFSKSAAFAFDAIKRNPFIAEIFLLMNQAEKNPDLPQKFRDKLGQNHVITTSVSLIEEGQRLGIIREGSPASLSIAFWLSIQGYAEMIALHPDTPYPETEWFVDILRAREVKTHD
ncbi:MAG: TetR/AcrR family transcriptional regulator [Oscillospiraceae bacterium]|nr:TetR/AcrR family transcriptional regulator [Oscillospiraceae bacterium]